MNNVRRWLWLWLYERQPIMPRWLLVLRCRVLGHHPNFHSLNREARTTTHYGPCLWCRVYVAPTVERWSW
jgi:hypothetical protein